MRLVFAEKPSMARSIAAAIGIKGSGKSSIRGRDLHGRDVVVTWGVGHLVALAEGFEAYDPALKAWTAETLPFIPQTFKTEVINGTKDQFKAVKELLKDPALEDVVVATDAGREGELIALYTFEKAGTIKKPIHRLWASSLTDESLREAYGRMKPWAHYRPLQESALCRSEADWIVGLNGTRALTLMARRMGRTEKGAWAVGRVMTPTLSILVNRELEIRNFKSQDFWILEGTFAAPEGNYKGKWFSEKVDRLDNEAAAKVLLAKVAGKPGHVAKVTTAEVRKNPEPFYDLTGLQKEANKRFGFTAQQTLDIAQELYEMKVLSYPRTNSCHLTQSDETKAPTWLRAVAEIPAYAPFVAEILQATGRPAPLGKRYVDDSEVEDHSALVPTEKAALNLNPSQQKIYDAVVRRFLAAWFPARVEAKTTIITVVEGETFKSHGTVVIDPGWTRVDSPALSKKTRKKGPTAGEEDEEEGMAEGRTLPRVRETQAVEVRDLKTEKKPTEPPKRLTEADLLGGMESAGKDITDDELKKAMKMAGVTGIGTPATRAATIEKLLSKGSPAHPRDPLVLRQGKILIPTQRGIDLIQLVPEPSLKSPELTGRWEAQLDDVRLQKGNRPAFMDRIAHYTQDLVSAMLGQAPSNEHSMDPESPRPAPKILDAPCPTCGSKVEVKHWEGRFYAKCMKKGGCLFGFDCDVEGKATRACPSCKTGRLKTTPKGRICADCGQWENTKGGGTRFEGPKPSEEGAGGQQLGECPKCHKGRLAVRKGQYGYFVSCSERCGLTYGSDEIGTPDGGHCKTCKGPVKKTQSGSRICVLCETWQDAKGTGSPSPKAAAAPGDRPPKPKDAKCPKCREVMRTLWTKREKWSYRCDPCGDWHDADAS